MKILRRLLPIIILLTLANLTSQPAAGQGPIKEPFPFSDRYPAEVTLSTWAEMVTLEGLDLDIGRVRTADPDEPYPARGGRFVTLIAEVYLNDAEAAQLAQHGLTAIPIPNESVRAAQLYGPGNGQPNAWPTFAQFVTRMQTLATNNPGLVQMVSMGTSVQGRDLWCLMITDNPASEEDEPEFKYTSSLHGDETVGIEITLRLAELLVSSYGSDPTLTGLVNNVEIWLCPISNPDGYVASTRYNSQGFDLNREFPDPLNDPVDDPTGRPLEVQRIMVFGYQHRFVMGANYHGGAAVVNYPWDAVGHTPSSSPDNGLFYNFSVGYAARNSLIYNGSFPNGVTQGWEWYTVYGGMQDWAYVWRGEHHVTIELGNTKKPAYEQMTTYWNYNRAAMIWWLQRVLSGFRGRVLDARTSAPLEAVVSVTGMNQPNSVRTDPEVGDYHRTIYTGTYTLSAAAAGYQVQTGQVTVIGNTSAAVKDFYLCPTAFVGLSGTVSEAAIGIPQASNNLRQVATLTLVGSPLSAQTNRANGAYSLQVCPASYTLRVTAPGYWPQERQVTITGAQVEDFALVRLPDLSASSKAASLASAQPGQRIDYQLLIRNTGGPDQTVVTDTLPLAVAWGGVLTATQGTASFSNGQITWQGALAPGQTVTVTYAVTVNACLAPGLGITNTVALRDAAGVRLTRTATVSVLNTAPSAPEGPIPGAGAAGLPLGTQLSWTASSDLNCTPLTYSVAFGTSNPPPTVASGLTSPSYDPGPLTPGTIYYWSVTASDGLTQTGGTVWWFSTQVQWDVWLPLVVK